MPTMPTGVIVERVSEEMEYATINQWLKEEGDAVAEGDPIVELEADKADYEILAPVAGIISKILAVAGDEVEVGATLALIEEG